MEYYCEFDDATIKHLIDALNTGINAEEITINYNGTFVAPEGKGYSPIHVNVPTGGSGDMGAAEVVITNNTNTECWAYNCITRIEYIEGHPIYADGEGERVVGVTTLNTLYSVNGDMALIMNTNDRGIDDLVGCEIIGVNGEGYIFVAILSPQASFSIVDGIK